ncbi:ATP-dependent RNA helicase DBP10 [Eurytemora carolleeae]|uniref:ATP-dependent RNA helicase DBP10 n=1 Tax=Eurytemora carolleeae TaxID=1294199 RepID=UPI000C76C138|nr:ATP-dependent RNA helicase DBP10 [Eurytemora carolleeae]|eukprot:XP_023342772.1 ATP-dependent RNA helicase DBP10-like [Eurytemora affinis]
MVEARSQLIHYSRFYTPLVSIVGGDCLPLPSFQEACLHTSLLTNLTKHGFQVPTPVQQYTIPLIMADRDVMVSAQTGGGKSAAFLIPIIHRLVSEKETGGGRCLVVTPSRETGLRLVQEARRLAGGTELIIRDSIPDFHSTARQRYKKKEDDPNLTWNILVLTPSRLDGLFKPEKTRKKVGDKVDEGKIKEEKEEKDKKEKKEEMDENNMEKKEERNEKEDEKDKKENLRFLVLDDFERLFEMGAVLNVRTVIEKLNPGFNTLIFSAYNDMNIRKRSEGREEQKETEKEKNSERDPQYSETKLGKKEKDSGQGDQIGQSKLHTNRLLQ